MKKRNIIIAVIALILLVAIISVVVIKNNKKEEGTDTKETVEKLTISFDTDGGTKVDDIFVESGSTATLPTTIKDGYNFLGWYDEETEVTEETKFTKNVTLTAKWEEIKKDAKTMKVSFDTKGGNKIKTVTMECGKPLSLPANPTKEGYKFVNWTDKKGNKESKGAELKCENITLYAKWEKETVVKYSCPNDYDIDADHKCTKKVAAKEKCDGDRSFEYNGKCVTITAAARKDTQKTCPQEHVTYMSFAGYVDGKVVNWGQWGCAYYKTNDTNSDTCTSHGFKWVTPEKACYVKWVGNGTTNTCNHLTNYAYITNPNSYEGVNGMNGGCFPVKAKTKYCESGFKLEGSTCIKQIEATKEEE